MPTILVFKFFFCSKIVLDLTTKFIVNFFSISLLSIFNIVNKKNLSKTCHLDHLNQLMNKIQEDLGKSLKTKSCTKLTYTN
ncbi:hypothetical protein BpHYR1_039518 [Brachionus plicatilis]|uniref:Uncharacterized protein n=1 Tax=Brachionus plicatilis TaxID=10195 RepID=A0A3M7R3L3_BRAPC|nr:hypothetical protein BpHYR1_039518 [Brachionus plicatilis]